MKNEELKEKNVKKGKKVKTDGSKKETEVKKEVSKSTKMKDSSKVVTSKAKVEKKVVEEVTVEENTLEDENKIIEKKNGIKKSDLFLVLGLVIALVLGFVLMGDKNPGPSYELPLTLAGDAGLQQLTYAEYQAKIDNNEEFVVILERATCSHCITYLPVAESFAKDNGVPMYYVDTDTFTSDDWNNFDKSISFIKKANNNWGTPTTVVQAGYETVGYIEGSTTADKLLELYNKYFDMSKNEE